MQINIFEVKFNQFSYLIIKTVLDNVHIMLFYLVTNSKQPLHMLALNLDMSGKDLVAGCTTSQTALIFHRLTFSCQHHCKSCSVMIALLSYCC